MCRLEALHPTIRPLVHSRSPVQKYLEPGEINVWHEGYVRPLAATLAKLAGWGIAMLLGSVFCLGCILSSLLLWARGICSVFEWYEWSLSEDGMARSSASNKARVRANDRRNAGLEKLDLCEVMPGEERRRENDWEYAGKIVRANNYRYQDDPPTRDFHLDHFLKMTTGVSMEDLAVLVDKKSRFSSLEEELMHAVDRAGAGDIKVREEVGTRTCSCARGPLNADWYRDSAPMDWCVRRRGGRGGRHAGCRSPC